MEGRWDQAGIPHKGWKLLGIYDLLEEDGEYGICEMCGKERIRYAHQVAHKDFPEILTVGCDCAEKMCDDYVNPKENEKSLKNWISRRKTFMRKPFETSRNGNKFVKHNGLFITFKKSKYGNWGFVVDDEWYWRNGGTTFKTIDEAKAYAFEIVDPPVGHKFLRDRAWQYV